MIPDRVLLPLHFDAPLLADDVNRLAPEAWIPHFNTAVYEGDWSGIPLRAPHGRALQLYPDPTAAPDDYEDTVFLAACPHVAGALQRLECPLLSVRFLRLGVGSRILPHNDLRLSADDGEIRLHIPITSSGAVEFHLDSRAVLMSPGECWYLDLTLDHSAVNGSSEARVHLVVDCVVNDWVRQLFNRGVNPAFSA